MTTDPMTGRRVLLSVATAQDARAGLLLGPDPYDLWARLGAAIQALGDDCGDDDAEIAVVLTPAERFTLREALPERLRREVKVR